MPLLVETSGGCAPPLMSALQRAADSHGGADESIRSMVAELLSQQPAAAMRGDTAHYSLTTYIATGRCGSSLLITYYGGTAHCLLLTTHYLPGDAALQQLAALSAKMDYMSYQVVR